MEKTKNTKTRSRIKSVKLWVTIWSMAMITYIVVAGKTDFYGVAKLLCSVTLSYVVANVAQKAIYKKYDYDTNLSSEVE